MPGGLGVDGAAHRKPEKVPMPMPCTRRQMRKRPRGEIWRAEEALDRWALSTKGGAGGAAAARTSRSRVQAPDGAPLLLLSRAEVFFAEKTNGFSYLAGFFHTWSALTFDACRPPRVPLTIETVDSCNDPHIVRKLSSCRTRLTVWIWRGNVCIRDISSITHWTERYDTSLGPFHHTLD